MEQPEEEPAVVWVWNAGSKSSMCCLRFDREEWKRKSKRKKNGAKTGKPTRSRKEKSWGGGRKKTIRYVSITNHINVLLWFEVLVFKGGQYGRGKKNFYSVIQPAGAAKTGCEKRLWMTDWIFIGYYFQHGYWRESKQVLGVWPNIIVSTSPIMTHLWPRPPHILMMIATSSASELVGALIHLRRPSIYRSGWTDDSDLRGQRSGRGEVEAAVSVNLRGNEVTHLWGVGVGKTLYKTS